MYLCMINMRERREAQTSGTQLLLNAVVGVVVERIALRLLLENQSSHVCVYVFMGTCACEAFV